MVVPAGVWLYHLAKPVSFRISPCLVGFHGLGSGGGSSRRRRELPSSVPSFPKGEDVELVARQRPQPKHSQSTRETEEITRQMGLVGDVAGTAQAGGDDIVPRDEVYAQTGEAYDRLMSLYSRLKAAGWVRERDFKPFTAPTP